MSKGLDILDRFRSVSAAKNLYLPIWQECADLYFPNRGGFTQPLIPGQETAPELYDTTPMQSRRNLATAIDALVKPATTRWFWLRAKEDALNDNDEAKAWFDAVCDRMWTAIYDPMARFVQHSGVVDNDLSAFGLGYLWIGENRSRNGMIFRSLFIGDCAIDENADGQVDTLYISRKFTARQAKQRFGDQVPEKVDEELKQPTKGTNKLFEFVQAICPREEYDQRKSDSKNMPFENCVVAVDGEKLVEESGFQEFPVAIPRWELAAGEIYPRSPGMVALPDSRTLQAMGRTLLIGGQRAVDPPTWSVDDGVLSIIRTYPGGHTTVDAEAIRQTNGKPLGVLEGGANVPIGREMQQDYRELVGNAFFKSAFNLPQKADMTATEVLERQKEFLRTIGPTLGQLENDYIGVIIRRTFGLMYRANAFPPPPQVLQGQDVNFEFMSPIQQAKRQVEMANFARAFEMVTPIIQLQPEVAQNIAGDEIIRDIPDIFGLPQKYIKPLDQVQQGRQQQQAAQSGAEALGQGQQVSDVIKTLAQAHANFGSGEAAAQQAQQMQPARPA